jgi:hypothetical protein
MPIDSYRYLDFASRQIIKSWVDREMRKTRPIPWTPMSKPLSRCTVALVTTAGVARRDDTPFDEEGERQNPWWGDPSYRVIPLGTTERDVRLHHLHIDRRFGQEDLDVVLLPVRGTGPESDGVWRDSHDVPLDDSGLHSPWECPGCTRARFPTKRREGRRPHFPKSNALLRSLAAASRAPSGRRSQRDSMSFKMEVVSYRV